MNYAEKIPVIQDRIALVKASPDGKVTPQAYYWYTVFKHTRNRLQDRGVMHQDMIAVIAALSGLHGVKPEDVIPDVDPDEEEFQPERNIEQAPPKSEVEEEPAVDLTRKPPSARSVDNRNGSPPTPADNGTFRGSGYLECRRLHKHTLVSVKNGDNVETGKFQRTSKGKVYVKLEGYQRSKAFEPKQVHILSQTLNRDATRAT